MLELDEKIQELLLLWLFDKPDPCKPLLLLLFWRGSAFTFLKLLDIADEKSFANEVVADEVRVKCSE